MNAVEYPAHAHNASARDGNRSSVSSEGFCDNDEEVNTRENRETERFDSDSQEGAGSESSSTASRRNNVREPTVSDSDRSGSNYQNNPSTSNMDDWSQNPTASTSRRPSKDESTSSTNSESPPSGDEYNVYFFNSKEQAFAAGSSQKPDAKEEADKDQVFSSIKKCDDPWDVLFSRAEGLHAHGHSREACILGVKLAEELLAHPPDLMVDIPPIPKRKGKKMHINPAIHQLSCLASATLGKCAFLCSVLAENNEYSHLAFRVG